MAGRHKWSEIRGTMSPEREGRIEEKKKVLRAEMALAELRRARSYTQLELAESLGIRQASVSQMEHGADMYVSTLRNFLRALGGDLEITARFPDGVDVRITQFEDLERERASA
jgi:transcriptional regulator with XRE-family HTH domain